MQLLEKAYSETLGQAGEEESMDILRIFRCRKPQKQRKQKSLKGQPFAKLTFAIAGPLEHPFSAALAATGCIMKAEGLARKGGAEADEADGGALRYTSTAAVRAADEQARAFRDLANSSRYVKLHGITSEAINEAASSAAPCVTGEQYLFQSHNRTKQLVKLKKA